MKKLWQKVTRSRTMLFALALAGLSALQYQVEWMSLYLSPGQLSAAGVIIAIAIAYLRSITDTSLEENSNEKNKNATDRT